jgi:hypothetical protein
VWRLQKRGEAGLIHRPYRVDRVPKPACAKETGEADPRDRPQKVEFELFLSSILHFYLVHK